MVKLLEEIERYRYVLEMTQEIIYEYIYEEDAVYLYGSLNIQYKEKNVLEPHIITHFYDNLAGDDIIHPADSQKVRFFIEGKLTGPIYVRAFIKGRYVWISIGGQIQYDEMERPIRLLGRILDVTTEKQEEQALLERARRDKTTNFLTWSVGIRMLDGVSGAGQEDSVINLFYLRILNINEVGTKLGAVFAEAVIARIATLIRKMTSRENLKIRVGYSSFIFSVNPMEAEAAQKYTEDMKKNVTKIILDIGSEFDLKFELHYFHSFTQLFNAMPDEERFAIDDNSEAQKQDNGYTDDIVTFTFNLMERSKDINSAIQLVLERICTQFGIEYLNISNRDSTSSQEILDCIYEVNLRPEYFEKIYGQKFFVEHSDMEALSDLIGEEDFVIIDKTNIGMFSEGMQAMAKPDNPILYAVIRNEDTIWGFMTCMHGQKDKQWIREEIDLLVELNKIIENYLLRDIANKASAAKSNFLSSMSHEIRTPMNAIKGFSELILAEDGISSQTKKYAADIRQASNNLVSIVNEILDFSKIESGKFEIIEDKYSVSSLLHDVTSVSAMKISEKPIDFIVTVDDNVPESLFGDVTRIRQIMINILNNSSKYTDVGEIEFHVSWEDGEDKGKLKVTVRDTGIGIKDEDLKKLFVAFTQVDTKKNRGITGTGLGLAVCRNLLNLMGGEIKVESEYGKGSVFSFWLPQTRNSEQTCNFKYGFDDHSNEDKFVVPFICPSAHFLVVDDNKVNLDVAKALLKEYGATVDTALSGREAIAIFEKNPDLDIIFMDHMMPVMDGIETTTEIRSRDSLERSKEVPIVALTANAIKGVEKGFFAAGMNDFMTKPIELKRMAQILDKWVPEDKKEKVPEDFNNKDDNESEDKNEKMEILKNTLKGIDIDLGLENTNGDIKTYLGLLEAFVEQDFFGMCVKQLEERDIKNYRISVHAMKSSARYIGAMKLSDQSKRMEDFAKEEKLDEILAEQELLKNLNDEVYESAKEAYDRCTEKKPRKEGEISLDMQKVIDALNKVSKQLDDFDYDAAADTVHEILNDIE
ncbi:ATP-binding protein [Lachnospiraceae bacterium C1.1]|nr:ATP-binding protein [Lachnospiraceae bacterium C1.1]